MDDKTLTCEDCGEEFTFSGEEQEFFAEKGFSEPKRCKDCRQKRKAGRGRGRKEMHDAVCAECGDATQVPFVPSGDRPVYCRDCYSKMR